MYLVQFHEFQSREIHFVVLVSWVQFRRSSVSGIDGDLRRSRHGRHNCESKSVSIEFKFDRWRGFTHRLFLKRCACSFLIHGSSILFVRFVGHEGPVSFQGRQPSSKFKDLNGPVGKFSGGTTSVQSVSLVNSRGGHGSSR